MIYHRREEQWKVFVASSAQILYSFLLRHYSSQEQMLTRALVLPLPQALILILILILTLTQMQLQLLLYG